MGTWVGKSLKHKLNTSETMEYMRNSEPKETTGGSDRHEVPEDPHVHAKQRIAQSPLQLVTLRSTGYVPDARFKYGFHYCEDVNGTKPQCLLYEKALRNNDMKPSLLE